MPGSLVVVGAGGLGREVAHAVRAINANSHTWDLLGFLDDGPTTPTQVDGLPVLGGTAALADLPDASVVVCVGRAGLHWSRKLVVEGLGLTQDRFATIIHPSAILPSGGRVGPGSVVLAGVIATTPVDVGAHVALMPGVILTHDDHIGDYATFASGVRLAGGVVVGEGAYLGMGSLVREQRQIGPWALVGMGAVVTRDVPGGEVWAGVPARFLRSAAVPDGLSSQVDR